MNPTVSVIIPVYNGEDFIARAIESVLAQTYPATEIIVVNDGSTDRTAGVLNQFDGRIKHTTVANAGVANARNVGIGMAQGELIAFLDADDIWHDDKLQKQVSVLQKFPGVDFCCCDYFLYDPYRKARVNHFSILDKDVNFDQPLRQMPVRLLLAVNFVGTASTVLLRRSLIDQVGMFNISYRQSEDFELWLRCAMATQFVLLSGILVDKKSHGGNLTNDAKESYTFHKTVLKDIHRPLTGFLITHGLVDSYYWAVARTNYKLAQIHYDEGDYRAAFSLYWQGLFAYASTKNVLRFLYLFSRKGVRFLFFDLFFGKKKAGEDA